MPSASLAAAAPYLAVGGGVASAFGSMTAGRGAANASYYNAAIEQQRADQIRAETTSNAQLQVEQNKRTMAQAVANYGASGVDTQSGTPLEVYSDVATQGELAKRLILYRGAVGALSAEEQASLDRFSGDQAITSSTFKAGSTLLTSFGQAGMSKYTPTTPAASSFTGSGAASGPMSNWADFFGT